MPKHGAPDRPPSAETEVVKGKPLYVGLAEKREVRAERLRGSAGRRTRSSKKE